MVGATVTRYVFDVGRSHSFLRAGLSRRFLSVQSLGRFGGSGQHRDGIAAGVSGEQLAHVAE
jgi:hypothetical protein